MPQINKSPMRTHTPSQPQQQRPPTTTTQCAITFVDLTTFADVVSQRDPPCAPEYHDAANRDGTAPKAPPRFAVFCRLDAIYVTNAGFICFSLHDAHSPRSLYITHDPGLTFTTPQPIPPGGIFGFVVGRKPLRDQHPFFRFVPLNPLGADHIAMTPPTTPWV